MTDSEVAGRLLREHVDTTADASSEVRARARFVERATYLTRPSRMRIVLVPAFAVLAAALVLVAVLAIRSRSKAGGLTFDFGADHHPGEVGAYLAPAGETKMPVRFSDGSTLVVQPNARIRVAKATSNGASVYLESGGLDVDVVPRPSADWGLVAGPYLVRVKGTSFHMMWNPDVSALEIQMRSGTVVVTGPGVEGGVEVQGTQRFVSRVGVKIEESSENKGDTDSGDITVGVESLPVLADDSHEPGVADSGLVDTGAPPSSASSSAGSGVPAEPSEVSWSGLLAKGEYKQVIEAAERRGIDATLSGGSADDLGALADAARFAGRAELSRRCLLALRSRFAGSRRASSAAFLLGRMADDGGNTSAALGWYDRYLAESPGGSLAADASGRRMLALRRLGNTGACRQAAEDYLRRYPSGSYAGVARELIQP